MKVAFKIFPSPWQFAPLEKRGALLGTNGSKKSVVLLGPISDYLEPPEASEKQPIVGTDSQISFENGL